jgi:AraC-like DNA-binding protein
MWRQIDIINRWGLGPKRPLRLGHTEWSQAGSNGGPHMHFGLELGIVLSGQIRRSYLDGTVDLSAGQLWWASSCEPHSVAYRSTRGEVMAFFALPRVFAADPVSSLDWMSPFRLPPLERPRLQWAAHRRAAVDLGRRSLEAEEGSNLQAGQVWVNLHRLLLMALEEQPPKHVPTPAAGPGQITGVTAALNLVEQSLPGPVSVTDAARACRLGRTAFCAMFKSTVGVSFGQYILECRLAGAARELLASEMALKTIAWKWQFSGASHLCRLFKQHYGCTPTEYRVGRQEAGPEPISVAQLPPAVPSANHSHV